MPKILIVDDEARILLLLQSLLKANGYDVVTAKDGNSALDAVKSDTFDLVITDLRMSPMDGLELFKEIKKLQPDLPVILLTAYASVETAIEALKNGAFDYLSKPFKVDEMLDIVKRAIESSKNAAAAVADPNAPLRYQFENLIAANSAMLQVCEMIQRVGPTAATVLINGESGTGKEVIARTIHNTSPRKEAVGGSELCRVARKLAGIGDVRPRQGVFHRGGRRQRGALRNRRRRFALP